MGQDYKNIAIIGAGASGCFCAYHLIRAGFDITLFDKSLALRTLLPTGGGRCNLAHAEYDFKDLAKNYPRGEKFLYSIFSKYSTAETIATFEEMGIQCYTQNNGRIFPDSNSAKEVRNIILDNIRRANIIKENVIELKPIDSGFRIKTSRNSQTKNCSNEYFFTHVILALGGHSGYGLIENLDIKVIEPRPSLVGLNTRENFKELSGTVVKKVCYNGLTDDLLFTHFGVSGPLIYTISSIKAFDKIPYKLSIDLAPDLIDLQGDLNENPHKEIKNLLSKYLPQKIVAYILRDFDSTTKAHKINGKMRDIILNNIHNFKIEIIGTNTGEETVTAGGIDLDEINSKTMEIKKYPNLFAIGEVLNIDGLCGGFNLQNAWSTAYVCAKGIQKSDK